MQIGDLFNVVNSELKSLTLLSLDCRPSERAEIASRVREFAGGEKLVSGRTFEQYCESSLVPFGAAVSDGNGGFSLSEEGRKYGQPVAAFSLAYAVENGLSLFSVFGGTSSHGATRSPENRMGILRAIGNQSQRLVDLERILGLRNYVAAKHCGKLAALGFLKFDSCGAGGQREFNYEINPEKDIVNAAGFGKYKPLSKLVIAEVAKTGVANRVKLAKKLGYHHVSLSYVLPELERQGFIRRVGWEAGNRMSDVSILERGKRFSEEYLDMVEEALADGLSLGAMEEIGKRFLEDKEWSQGIARKAVELYRKVSSMMNAKPREVTDNKVVDYVRNHGGVRPSEIFRALNLPHNNTKYLTPLIKSGRLRKVDEGKKVSRYYVV